jgi:hypothetical protein
LRRSAFMHSGDMPLGKAHKMHMCRSIGVVGSKKRLRCSVLGVETHLFSFVSCCI